MNRIQYGDRTGKFRTAPLPRKNKKKVFNAYLKDIRSKLTLEEAMSNVYKQEPEYKYSYKPKTMSISEAEDYMLGAVTRGISISSKVDCEGETRYSIFSTCETKAVLHEEAKALKLLTKKNRFLLDKLVVISNKLKGE